MSPLLYSIPTIVKPQLTLLAASSLAGLSRATAHTSLDDRAPTCATTALGCSFFKLLKRVTPRSTGARACICMHHGPRRAIDTRVHDTRVHVLTCTPIRLPAQRALAGAGRGWTAAPGGRARRASSLDLYIALARTRSGAAAGAAARTTAGSDGSRWIAWTPPTRLRGSPADEQRYGQFETFEVRPPVPRSTFHSTIETQQRNSCI